MPIEFVVLLCYFFFIFGLIYMANNVNQIADHPMTEQIVNKFRYNLRDVPRVDYTEPVSDESEQESDSAHESYSALRQRRDPNPISRIISEGLN